MSVLPLRARGGAILRRLPVAGPVTVAEVGVFVGALSKFLLVCRPDLTLIMVDNWAPAEQQPASYRATGDRHSKQTAAQCEEYRLKAKRNTHKYRARARVIMESSVNAATKIEDSSLDLVFLDADHSEPSVRADLVAWEPKVKPGGWIGGHDFGCDIVPGTDFSGVARAVTGWAAGRSVEIDADYTWFCRLN